ncbi:YraN family protein [Acidaminococcus provencensis]|uniref:YraN family protein n=1 Tax=Acidaminococcus provencensis TaxID=2058289 RepID=UPI00190EFAFB
MRLPAAETGGIGIHEHRCFGNWGEDAAAQYLEKQGYRIVARNYACAYGELDIIAQTKNTLVFVEVKSRRSLKFGRPAAAVTREKQVHLHRAVFVYLKEHPGFRGKIRFDIIEVLSLHETLNINHMQACF